MTKRGAVMEAKDAYLPEHPTGFEDYLAAADKVVHTYVCSPERMLYATPGVADESGIQSETISHLWAIMNDPSASDPSQQQLVYDFAYAQYMQDTTTNSRTGYAGMLDAISVAHRFEAQYEALSPDEQVILQLDEHMAEAADILSEIILSSALEVAEKRVKNDTLVRIIGRRIGLLLGLIDEERELNDEPADNSEWSWKMYLTDLGVARQRLVNKRGSTSNPMSAPLADDTLVVPSFKKD